LKKSIIKEKSYLFAIKIVQLSQYLINEKKEYVLSRQILKSGTSIGANIEEALGGQSEKDFIAKLAISYKEARETDYWLRILKDTHYISSSKFSTLSKDLLELLKMLGSIQITYKKKLRNLQIRNS